MSSIKSNSNSNSLFTLSCNNLDQEVETMWTAFNRCKAYIENGSRYENMSWRLWQYRQQANYIDNKTIKRLITSIIMSPVNIHDAYSHEVSQINQKCYGPTQDLIETKVQEQEEENKKVEDDYISEYDDDEDDDEDLYDDDIIIEIKQDKTITTTTVYDFKKTHPKPTTPKRSLLSDLFGRPSSSSSPPSLLSNSTCSSISLTDDQQQQQQQQHHQQHQQQQHKQPLFHKSNHDTLNWNEEDTTFHGW